MSPLRSRPRINSVSSTASSDSVLSTTSSIDSDDDQVNTRIYPYWEKYRSVIDKRGFRLNTYRDVKQFYERNWDQCDLDELDTQCYDHEYKRACRGDNEDALCRDAGLPENLFRGTRMCDEKAIIVKAVRLRSREFDVVRMLSTPPLCNDPMNHTIPVLDLIEVPEEDVAFIVQEEWSSQLVIPNNPCTLRDFLRAVRQCIEGLVFMHTHRIAHLDISLRNVLTDYQGRYNYIDFEMSRRYDNVNLNRYPPRIVGYRGTEIPPEVERGEESDPFKIDIWALAVLILRASKLTGHELPELLDLTRPMLHASFERRPPIRAVMQAFDRMVARIPLNGSVPVR